MSKSLDVIFYLIQISDVEHIDRYNKKAYDYLDIRCKFEVCDYL